MKMQVWIQSLHYCSEHCLEFDIQLSGKFLQFQNCQELSSQ